MSSFPIGSGAGNDRRFHSADTTFIGRDDLPQMLINAFHLAAEKAADSARIAVVSGDLSMLRKAQWDEAVAATLERTLQLLSGDEDGEKFDGEPEFIFPERPRFDDGRA